MDLMSISPFLPLPEAYFNYYLTFYQVPLYFIKLKKELLNPQKWYEIRKFVLSQFFLMGSFGE